MLVEWWKFPIILKDFLWNMLNGREGTFQINGVKLRSKVMVENILGTLSQDLDFETSK